MLRLMALDSPHTFPGQVITGCVQLIGAETAVALVASVEGEYGDHELSRVFVRQGLQVPFELPVPWQTPITEVGGTRVPELAVGVRVGGDLEPVRVLPAPSQAKVLDALAQMGFRLFRATVDDLGFLPPVRYAGRITEVELRFVATPQELSVIIEADRRGSPGRFQVTHEFALTVDWSALIAEWLTQVCPDRTKKRSTGKGVSCDPRSLSGQPCWQPASS